MTRLNLRTCREGAGMTQSQAATALDLTQSTYSKIERGAVDLSLCQAVKLAAAFGCQLQDLVAS